MTHPAHRPEPARPDDVLRFVQAIHATVVPIMQAFAAGAQNLMRVLQQASRDHRDWVRSDEGQAYLRHERDLEWIRDRAKAELAVGKATTRTGFDRLYADLGLTRQEH